MREYERLTERRKGMTTIQLFNENTKLVYSIYNKEFYTQKHLKDDLIQIGMLALWKACCKFDSNRNIKFSTFAYRSIYNNMKCFYVRTLKKEVCTISLSQPITDEGLTYEESLSYPVDFVESIEISEIFNNLFNALDRQEQQIIKAISDGYNRQEISEILGVSKVKIQRILKKFREKLKNTLLLTNSEYNK